MNLRLCITGMDHIFDWIGLPPTGLAGFAFLRLSRRPDPFSSSAGMNSTPAASSAVWIFQSVRAEPVISSASSIRFTVLNAPRRRVQRAQVELMPK